MKKVVYIFRPKGKAYSIERVFKPIMDSLRHEKEVSVEVSHAINCQGFFRTLFANIRKYAELSRSGCICHITCEVRYCAIFMRKSHTVLTTHDIMSLHNPEASWYARWFSYWFQFYFPMRHLNYLTCVSESTRKDLVSLFPWVEHKLQVIPNPIDNDFKHVAKSFNKDKPVVLHIGTKANKNLIRVAFALNGIPCHLRIVGRLSDEQKKALQENKVEYSCVFGITNEQIVKEYENCDMLSFPSLFECFGMPIIEAQAVGRPVLTSNREPMLSVAGGAAVYVNPESIDEIKKGFLEIINGDSVRDKLVKEGLSNINKYSVETIANQYLNLYKQMESDFS